MRPSPPRVRRNLEVGQGGNSRSALQRAGSMSLSQSAITQWGWGFHTLRGGIDQGDLRFRPRFAGVVETWKDF